MITKEFEIIWQETRGFNQYCIHVHPGYYLDIERTDRGVKVIAHLDYPKNENVILNDITADIAHLVKLRMERLI